MNDDIDLFHNSIDISYKNITIPSWLEHIGDFCLLVLNTLNIKNWEVSLVFCDDEFIAELNETYRSKKGPTDVLSFSQLGDNISHVRDSPSKIIFAGDIVISIPTLLRNINTLQINREEELKRLIIHGMLHLAGMEHKENGCEMLQLQEKLLNDLMGGKS